MTLINLFLFHVGLALGYLMTFYLRSIIMEEDVRTVLLTLRG